MSFSVLRYIENENYYAGGLAKCFIFFRCSPKCPAITGGDAVIGKRSFDGKIGNGDRQVLVSAGPFYFN